MKTMMETVQEVRQRIFPSPEPVSPQDNAAAERDSSLSEKEKQWNLLMTLATKTLWVLSAIFLVALIVTAVWSVPWPEVPVSAVDTIPAEPLTEQVSSGDFSEYENIFRRRNIFEAGSARSPLASEDSPTGFDLSGRYRLVGLIVDQHPQIIVEDQTTNETTFLKPGDSLEGAVLEEIQDGRALFVYNGQRMELKP